MRKIWYLKQEKGQRTRTAKIFLYEKNGHVEGRMDLSAFCGCGKEEEKNLLLHLKDASGKDVGKIELEEGTFSYERFFQGKGKLKEELADKLRSLKGEVTLAVTLGKERYLSEGWKEGEAVPEKEDREKKTGKTKEKGEEKETESKQENKRDEKESGKGINGGEKDEKKEQSDIMEELEAEELLQEDGGEKRIVQLSVLEDELFFRSYVHNSFLLHGYYNYGHVMIDESREEPRLGVPGNYYEREKMVAEMFGFPAFEPAREGEQITNGTFGYFYTKG